MYKTYLFIYFMLIRSESESESESEGDIYIVTAENSQRQLNVT